MTFPGPPDVEPIEPVPYGEPHRCGGYSAEELAAMSEDEFRALAYRLGNPPVFRPSNGWWPIIFLAIACWIIACACILAAIWIGGMVL